jgi:hypothetical protein
VHVDSCVHFWLKVCSMSDTSRYTNTTPTHMITLIFLNFYQCLWSVCMCRVRCLCLLIFYSLWFDEGLTLKSQKFYYEVVLICFVFGFVMVIWQFKCMLICLNELVGFDTLYDRARWMLVLWKCGRFLISMLSFCEIKLNMVCFFVEYYFSIVDLYVFNNIM